MQQVILFGFRTCGTNTERSDVDIAIRGDDFDSFYFDIMENVHSLLMFDIINLNEPITDELKSWKGMGLSFMKKPDNFLNCVGILRIANFQLAADDEIYRTGIN